MASLRDIRNRIASVKNTRQITNAMKMVSAAKLRRATDAATNARPYQRLLTDTLQRVAGGAGEIDEPLLRARPEVKKVLAVIVGTDRGLCGGFNGTLNRRSEEWLRKQAAEGKEITLWSYGKKPRDFMKARGLAPAEARIDMAPAKFAAEATRLADELATAFVEGTYDEVWLLHNHFKSTLSQIPTFAKVLPLTLSAEKGEGGGENGGGPEYLYEPAPQQILGALLPLYLRTILLQAFLENEAGEHAARMSAMDNATRNASDLIKNLTLEYNRGRQAAITKELIEIVSGAEAL